MAELKIGKEKKRRIDRITISKILNHAEGGVTSTYDRYDHADEKREALDAWAQKLASIINPSSPDNVVEFKAAG
jgi:integrase